MVTDIELLRADITRQLQDADEEMLHSIQELMQSSTGSLRLSEPELERIRQARQRRIDGEQGYTLDEIFARRAARKSNGSV